MKDKKRLDVLLIERGLFTAREKAKAAIMAGEVLVDGQRIDKAGTAVADSVQITVKGKDLPYVSRGGLKLAKAIEVFALDLSDLVILDIGSSTGGFVDCALQNGAAKVYAVDVGYGQLAWKLRQDERVVVLEKTNARYLTEQEIPQTVDMITVDASFISLAKVLEAACQFLAPTGQLVALIKPQFEAGREKVGKKGVVRNRDTHREVLEQVLTDIEALGLAADDLDFSPITGPEGNIEYLLLAKKAIHDNLENCRDKIATVIDKAWSEHK